MVKILDLAQQSLWMASFFKDKLSPTERVIVGLAYGMGETMATNRVITFNSRSKFVLLYDRLIIVFT